MLRNFKHKYFYLKFLFFFLMASVSPANILIGEEPDSSWQPLGESQGVKVYKRSLPDSKLIEFRGIGEVTAPIPKLIALMADVKYMPEWVFACRKGELISRDFDEDDYTRSGSDYHITFYGINELPWPFEKRDYILNGHVEFVKQTAKQPSHVKLVMQSTKQAAIPPKSGMVRIESMSVNMVLTPVLGSEGKTQIDFTASADPAGIIPAWVTNIASRDIPAKTLVSLNQLVKKKEYNFRLEKLVKHHYEKTFDTAKNQSRK